MEVPLLPKIGPTKIQYELKKNENDQCELQLFEENVTSPLPCTCLALGKKLSYGQDELEDNLKLFIDPRVVDAGCETFFSQPANGDSTFLEIKNNSNYYDVSVQFRLPPQLDQQLNFYLNDDQKADLHNYLLRNNGITATRYNDSRVPEQQAILKNLMTGQIINQFSIEFVEPQQLPIFSCCSIS